MLTSLFSLFYVTGELNRFLHRGGVLIQRERQGQPDLTSSSNISATPEDNLNF